MSRILVTGAGGFIGHHLVKALKAQGHFVRGVDLKRPEFEKSEADLFIESLDLRSRENAEYATQGVDEVYALAADMGGMGHITTHDADILSNNLSISLNTVLAACTNGVPKITYTSSACIYPEYRQLTTEVTPLREDQDYPADPNEGYGWEKLTTERLLLAFAKDRRIDCRIARLHAIYGPLGTWDGGREKAPAALSRKVAQAEDGGSIEVWGDGKQTRSFCYIDDCVEGLLRLSASDYQKPLNIGSDSLVTIDETAHMIMAIAGKNLSIEHIPGPQGVRGRNSDNTRIRSVLGWAPSIPLEVGLQHTYKWVSAQVEADREGV